MNKLRTITIGIPAFNEENNIGKLLQDISNQDLRGFNLEQVILASDGSTDMTIRIARKFKTLPLKIFNNKERKGVAEVQNQISENSSSDVLVILNADIRILDPEFIRLIVEPILEDKADLVSGRLEEVDGKNHFEVVLQTSMKIKRVIFEKFNDGNNLFTCYGVARAFSKRLYSELRYKNSVGEDAYSYLFCISNNFKYRHMKNAIAFYKLPDNMGDHEKQSIRFVQSKQKNMKLFGKNLVEKEYNIPLYILFWGLILAFKKYPKLMTEYLFIFFYLKLKGIFSSGIQNTWEIASSSKIINM